MRNFKLVFYIFCLTQISGCFLAFINELPEETQEGLDTFGMLLDGEKWKPSLPGILLPTPDTKGVSYHVGSRSMRFYAENNKNENHERIEFYITDVNTEGIYRMQVKNPRFDEVVCSDSTRFNPNTNNSYDCIEAYRLLDDNLGTVEVRFLDTLNRIISGSFEAEMFNRHGEKISITEGRFDFRY